jgi:type IV pilus assembly protein PilA
MRPELQAKLLQHLNKKKGNEGFTLVELLVVVIIIGILAAIALPSFLNQATAAKQSEGRQNVAAIIRAQQNWRGGNSTYASSFDQLALGVAKGADSDSTSSSVYTYTLQPVDNDKTSAGALFKDNKLKSYSGATSTSNNTAGNPIWSSIQCESSGANTAVSYPTGTGSTMTCDGGFIELKVAGK